MAPKKTKSTVNSAKVYTKPTLRRRIFNKIMREGKGGAPGQWSARKAQMLAREIKQRVGVIKNNIWILK
jgi:hypothetical protein